MIDAFGVERPHGSPYVAEGINDDTGCYALVHLGEGTPDCWRYRGFEPDFECVESEPHAFTSVQEFKAFVQARPRNNPIRTFEPTYFVVSLEPELMSLIIGTLILFTPVAFAAYWLWKWMGWL